MKFKDKLVKLRKANNLSQETLAEKLNMSRQAISKWESGNSYPDMSTMINICKVLNCTLEDLLDDDAIGNNNLNSNKKNPAKWLKDFLDFITKTYNMFWSMNLKQKLSCIIEMILIILFLIAGFAVIHEIFESILIKLFSEINNNIIYKIYAFLNFIYSIISIALGLIIFIHLFKIRYLDYFITITDNTIDKREIEEDIEKNKQKYIEKITKEKIVIRDPKHTPYSFFMLLSKIIVFCVKTFSAFILIFSIISFVFLIFTSTVLFIFLKYGLLFFGILISFIGLVIINYNIIELLFKFIFNRVIKFRRIFITFIIALVLVGVGSGISASKIMTLKKQNNSLNYDSKTFTIKVEDNLKIFDIWNTNNIIFDDEEENIIVKIKHLPYVDVDLKASYEISTLDNGEYHYINYMYIRIDIDYIKMINVLLNDLKKSTYRDYDNQYYFIESITISRENYNKMIKTIDSFE